MHGPVTALTVAIAGLLLAGCTFWATDEEPSLAADVSIVDFRFEPNGVEVEAGGTVTWTNRDSATHNVTAEDGSFSSGGLAPGDSWSHTFDEPGAWEYRCTIHPSMQGTVVVP